MEKLSIKQFTQSAQPFTPFKGPLRTLQPLRQVPKVKRPVGRPRKRPCEDPDTRVPPPGPSESGEASLVSSEISKPTKKVKAAYTIAKKQQVVKYAKEHSVYQACKHFNLSPGTVGPWMKINFSKENTVVFRIAGSGRKLSYPMEKEEQLVAWVLEQRDLHLAVTVQHIVDQARLTIQPSTPSFQGSRGWIQKFMRRNNLSLRAKTSIAQKLPAALEEKMATFIRSVRDVRKELKYPDSMIVNMDETPMYFDMTTNKTVNQKGAKTVSVRSTGADKRRLTVVLAASGDGQMLSPMIIFKGKGLLRTSLCLGKTYSS
jgi:hypothetical protein